MQDQKKRILLVEDSTLQAFALRNFLEKHGFNVFVAEDGRDALSFLATQRADLLISDIEMPEMNGYELCLALKSKEDLKSIPVILLTNLSKPENIIEGLKSRADYYLTKPFAPQYLLDRVKTLLNSPKHTDLEDSNDKQLVVMINGQHYSVDADRRQMLNLLLSTYENSVQQNRELLKTQSELNTRNRQLREQSEKLKISEASFRSLLENHTDAMLVVDSNSYVRFCNPAAQQLIYHKHGFSPGVEFDFPLELNVTREFAIPHADGSAVIVELRVVKTIWEDEASFLASFRDVTQRKLAEKRILEQQEELQAANQQLKALATIDGLTGVKNFRCFTERLHEEFQKASSQNSNLSLILLDVDHFKSFNDTFGHPAGDEVLKRIANLLYSNARNTDLVARYGGEEFVVLLPDAGTSLAIEIAERLRRAIASASWFHRSITASFGVSTISGSCANEIDLVAAADRALYHSKRTGRNQVNHVQHLPLETPPT